MFEDLIPELQEPARQIVAAAAAARLSPRVTSTRRSHTLQTKLYRRFQQGLSQFPVAPPGTSAHEFGYAFDMVTSPFSALEDVGYTWQQWGGVWGNGSDPVHFEYPGFVPPSTSFEPEAAAAKVGNILVGFIPGVGQVQLGATFLSFFPGWKNSEILDFISNPLNNKVVQTILRYTIGF